MNKTVSGSLLSVGLCLALAACAPGGAGTNGTSSVAGSSSSSGPVEQGEAIAPLPADVVAAAAKKDGTETSDKNADPNKVETIAPIPTAMETFRQLQPASGIKFTKLFDQSAGSDEARFKRLETAVQGLRNDLDTVMPTMVRMVNMEDDLRDLIAQLRSINGETSPSPEDDQEQSNGDPIISENLAPPPAENDFLPESDELDAAPVAEAPAEEAAPSETVKEKKAGKIQTQLLAAKNGDGFSPAAVEAQPNEQAIGVASASIKSVRLGDHGAVTRIVLDATAKPGYSARLENEGRQLVIELSGTGWGAAQAAKLRNKKVTGYRFENNRVVFDLAAPMQIKSQQLLPPEAGAGYRIMINLADAAGAAQSPAEDNFLP